MDEDEYFFTCPYCGAEVSVLLDLSMRHTRYVEDCELCCNPIEIDYTVEDWEVVDFWAHALHE